jgi:hypothetical protein
MCTAPQVLRKLQADEEASERLARAGVKLGTTCVETLFEGDVIVGETAAGSWCGGRHGQRGVEGLEARPRAPASGACATLPARSSFEAPWTY